MKKTSFIVIALMLAILSLSAQETEEQPIKKGGLAGPGQVENQIVEDETPKQPFFELGFMQPYFGFKENLKNNNGFGFGLDYSSAYFSGKNSTGEDAAGSGMVRFYGSWDLVGRGTKNTGALNFKVEHRHKYTTIPLSGYGFQAGYVGMVLPPFSDQGFRMTNFYWRQRLFEGKVSFMAGLLDATDYVDVYGLASPWMHFSNFAFSTGSQTIYIPNDAALGIGVGTYLSKNLYAIASISDAGSDPTDPFGNFESFFSNGDYFKSVELGWTTGKDRHYFDNIHLTYWHSDGTEVTASLPGWGIAFSGTWFFNNKFMPFIRGGFAEDGGTLMQKSLNVGFGWYQAKKSNVLGVALGWGEVNETTWAPGLDDQITMEVFYRLQVSSRLAITPDLQYLINPALNPDDSSLFLWGVRARLAL